MADEAPAATLVAAPADASTPSSSSSSAPSAALQPFLDNEYELQVPSNYTYIETPIVRVERGPQPERSPVLARFEAPDGAPGTISILMRKANALKQTILQVWLVGPAHLCCCPAFYLIFGMPFRMLPAAACSCTVS